MPLNPTSSQFLPSPPKAQAEEPQEVYLDRGPELPHSYGRDRLAAFARDPECLWAYWTLDGPRLAELRAKGGEGVLDGARWVLRFHDWTHREVHEVDVDPSLGNRYVPARPNCRYIVELGLHSNAGFFSVLTSNEVHTPRNGPSDVEDAAWPMSEAALEQLRLLLGMSEFPIPGRSGGAAWLSGSSPPLGGSSPTR